MYLARFEGEGATLAQGAALIEGAPAAHACDAYTAQAAAIGAAFHGVGSLCLAVRIRWAPGSALQRLFVVTAPARQESTLRAWLASFTRLEQIAGESVEIPADRARHDEILRAVPPICSRIVPLTYETPAGAWLSFDAQVHPVLRELTEEADMLGHALWYQAHIVAFEPGREELRAARRNLWHLEQSAGVPSGVLADQQGKVERFGQTRFEIEEHIGVETTDARAWITEAITRRLSERIPDTRRIGEPVALEADVHADDLAVAMHRRLLASPQPITPAERLSSAAQAQLPETLLRWTPPGTLGRAPVDEAAPGLEADPGRTAWPVPPYGGADDFLFISYSHADAEASAGVVEQIASADWPVWYDRGIPGGAEWDALIEQRLGACAGVVVLLSEASVASRYVRREIKYADAIGKPLIGVLLEPLALTHGLGMLFAAEQLIRADGPEVITQISEALRYLHHRRIA